MNELASAPMEFCPVQTRSASKTQNCEYVVETQDEFNVLDVNRLYIICFWGDWRFHHCQGSFTSLITKHTTLREIIILVFFQNEEIFVQIDELDRITQA